MSLPGIPTCDFRTIPNEIPSGVGGGCCEATGGGGGKWPVHAAAGLGGGDELERVEEISGGDQEDEPQHDLGPGLRPCRRGHAAARRASQGMIPEERFLRIFLDRGRFHFQAGGTN